MPLLLLCATVGPLSAFAQKGTPAADPAEQHFKAAQTFQLTGDYDKAAAEYREAIINGLQHLGNLRVSQGKYKEGATLLEQAVKLGPQHVEAQIDLAIAYFRLDDFKASKQTVDAVIATTPQNPRALNLRGKIAFMQQDFQSAASDLRSAYSLQPDFDLAYSLAVANLKLKRPSDANVIFDEMFAAMKPSAQLHALVGVAYRETGYLEQAIQHFSKAITLDPAYPRAHASLALTYLLQGQEKYANAESEFHRELAVNAKDYQSRYFLGILELQQQRADSAAKWLQEATAIQPDDASAWFQLGKAFLQLKKYEAAANAFKKSLDAQEPLLQEQRAEASALLKDALQKMAAPSGDTPHTGISKSAPVSDELKSAASSQRELHSVMMPQLKSAKDAAPEAEYVSAVSRMLGDSYNNLGVIAAMAGNYSAAASEFAQAATWNPAINGLDKNWGLAAFRANRFAEAIAPLKRRMASNPDMGTRQMLGLCYFLTDNFAEASQTFKPIAAQLPNDPGVLYAAGVSFVRSGDSRDGAAIFSRMLRQNQDNPEIHVLLGQAFAAESEYNQALVEFSRALELKPGLPDAHYYSGMVKFRQGKLDDAAREFQSELTANAKNPDAAYQLAYIKLEQHLAEESIGLLTRVIEEKPEFADAYYLVGKAYLEKGDVTAAINNLEKATRLHPEADYTYYQLSRAYKQDGRLQDSEKALKTYESLKSMKRPPATGSRP